MRYLNVEVGISIHCRDRNGYFFKLISRKIVLPISLHSRFTVSKLLKDYMEDFVQQNLEESDFAAENISYTHVSSIIL